MNAMMAMNEKTKLQGDGGKRNTPKGLDKKTTTKGFSASVEELDKKTMSKDEDNMIEEKLVFQPGPVGIGADIDGVVTSIAPDSQAMRLGVKVAWRMHMLEEKVFESQDQLKALLMEKRSFYIIFKRPKRDKKFEVVQVIRNENASLWRNYYHNRKRIDNDCKQLDGVPPLTFNTAQCLKQFVGFFGNQCTLREDINEAYLFYGTSPSVATSICESRWPREAGSTSGSAEKLRYGPGLYFAEAATKSDDYAKDEDGLRAMLLCRVCCGNSRYNDELTPDSKTLQQELARGTYHSILGEPSKAPGAHREFVSFDVDHAYPEYIVLYKRLDNVSF
jgi:hypothetical protein